MLERSMFKQEVENNQEQLQEDFNNDKSENSSRLIDRIADKMDIKLNSNESYNFMDDVADLTEVPRFSEHFDPKTGTKSKKVKQKLILLNSQVKPNFFNNMKPLNDLLIYPVINAIKPIFKFFGYKSMEVALLSSTAFLFGLYYAYNKKKNIVWLFIFFGVVAKCLDTILYNKHKSKDAYKNYDKSIDYLEEQINILAKLIGFIISYIFLSFSDLANFYKDNNAKQSLYFILFTNIILFFIINNVKKNYANQEKKNKDKTKVKLLKNLGKKLNIINYFVIGMIVTICLFIVKNRYENLFVDNKVAKSNKGNKGNKTNKENSFLNLFLIDEGSA
jgi:hypothetical protein